MTQRSAFKNGEGDAWFLRNLDAVKNRQANSEDPIMSAFANMGDRQPRSVLEIGCGAGQRGAAIATATGASVSGIDPSAQAVSYARKLGLDAHVATADALPFESGRFDAVLFGFCLYLCDREDLFRIASEADRVLAELGWLVIHDFFSPVPKRRPYHHREGIWSYKMDYRRLFDWHPSYTCVSHNVMHHVTGMPTDQADDWVAVSVLRKTSLNA